MDFGVDFADLSTADFNVYADLETNYLIREGLGTVVASMADGLPIQLSTPARAIDWSGDGVRVETDAGTIRAKACIVTVSTGVLAAGAIRFTPELPDWKSEAIQRVPMGLLAKIALQFDGETFGLSANAFLSYQLAGSVPAEACYFLTFPFGSNVAVGFVGGSFGWELSRAGPDAAIAFALEEFEKMVGSGARRHFVKGHFTDWAENPLTLGAYAAAKPGHHAARAELGRPLGGRVFFAGEALAGAYIALCSGAYLSGDATAGAVAATLDAGCGGCAGPKSSGTSEALAE